MSLKSKLPEFEVEAKPAPFTLDSLIEWLRTKEPEEEYDFWCHDGGCLIGQYSTSVGSGYRTYAQQIEAFGRYEWRIAVACCDWPRTFGGVLNRLLSRKAHGGGE